MASEVQTQQCLANTLNPDGQIRAAAEEQLASLFAHQEAGLWLSRIILAQDVDLGIRQMTSIALRKYVNERWSPYFQSFKGNAPPPEIKTTIRQSIFQSLSDPNRKIRTLCAHTLSTIATCDWPDEYPDLLTTLIESLSSHSPDSVHGAMQVLVEFIKADLTEDQILPILRTLLPVLMQILGGANQYTPLTRARSVSVFRQCVTALYMVKDQHPQSVQEATSVILPEWLEAFRVILEIDPRQDFGMSDNWDALAVRIQVFKALDTIQTCFPRPMNSFMDAYMNASLNHLNLILPTFIHFYVVATETPPGSSEDDAVGVTDLICPLLDFATASIRRGKAKEWLNKDTLEALVGSVISYAQMTEEDEESWANNPNAFVAQEDEGSYNYNVRIACFDLFSALVDRSPVPACAAFQSNVQRLLSISQQEREQGLPNWWKSLEATLSAVGSQSEVVIEAIENEIDSGRTSPIDIESLLVNVIPAMLTLAELPYMQGRGFVFASRYSSMLPPSVAGKYLEAAIQIIESAEAGVPVKISAVMAINNFCQGVTDSELTSFLPRIAHDLGPFLVATTEDTLSLVLETLQIVIETDDGNWITSEMASSILNSVLEVWGRNKKDPLFLSVFSDILESLAKVPASYETIVKEALPRLSSQIGTSAVEDWTAQSAIELVDSLIKGAPETGLGEGFFALLAPNLFACLDRIEDRDALQSGVICLTNIVRKDSAQILHWSDGNGQSGLDRVFGVIARILRSEDESGGLAIGDLIIHLWRRVGQAILPVLPELLQALVGRMPSAKTASFLQSLVIPFAFLIQSERDTVLTLLESTDVNGRNGLEVLIHTWCENAETFQGFWPNRISALGLTSLYVAERPSLQHIMVKGDIVHRPEISNVIMTRSKTKTMPLEFTSIPFPVKAMKILVHELRSGGESAAINVQDDFEVESDDGDEEWAEEENVNKRDEFEFLSDMLGPRGVAFDNDDVLDIEEDEDLKDDPIWKMDMQAHLIGFFRECQSRNTGNFAHVVGQLSADEMLVVQRAVSQQS